MLTHKTCSHTQIHPPTHLDSLVHHRLLLANGHNQLVGLSLLLLHYHQVIFQRDLQVGDLCTGLCDFVHTIFQALLGAL